MQVNEEFYINDELMDELQEYSYGSFDIGISIEEAKSILQQEMMEQPLNKCEFGDNIWYLYENRSATRKVINFEELIELINFNKELKNVEFSNIVKCWVTTLFDSYSPSCIQQYVSGISGFLTLTKGLTNLNIDDISDDFSLYPESYKRACVLSSLNLFEYFSELKDHEVIISLLYLLKQRYKVEGKVRILPPSRDILVFAKIVEDYFSRKLSELEYLRWFPIWLWWELTNLIPIRPSEFCYINRKSPHESDGNYYIKLPRIKGKFNKIQVVDTLYIPKEIYLKLIEYKQLTERFGKTETFISYSSIPHFSVFQYHDRKLVQTKFTHIVFYRLLKSFYENIVFGKYNIQFNPNNSDTSDFKCISQKLRPNDTRHLAFINMKKQGYHPVEIARMGGHTCLRSQEHYFNHIQNYIDLEILELITNTDLNSYSNKISDGATAIGIEFINKYVLRQASADFKIVMEDGFCTDKEQRCMDEDCWNCDNWGISAEELLQKQHILEEKIKQSKSYLNEAIENLKNLYKAIYDNIGTDEYYSSGNTEIRKQLINHSKYVEKAIHKYVNLYKIKERIDSIGGQEGKTLPGKGN